MSLVKRLLRNSSLRIWGTSVLFSLVLAVLFIVPLFASYTDCDYYFTVTIANNSTTSYDYLRFKYPVNAGSLISSGYMQADADDVFLVSGSTGVSNTSLSLGSNGVYWTGSVASPAYSSTLLRLYTGNPAEAGRNQGWLADDGDVGTVADTASLDISTNLTVSANLTLTGVAGTIANKDSAYSLTLSGSAYTFSVVDSSQFTLVDTDGDTGTNSVGIYGVNWASQNITYASDYWVDRIGLYCYEQDPGGTTGNFIIGLRATDSVTRKPTGSDLTSCTVVATTLPDAAAWMYFTFTAPYKMLAGVQYALVARATTALTGHTIIWQYDTSQLYLGGQTMTSADSGGTWTPVAGDSLFRTYKCTTISASTGVVAASALKTVKGLCNTTAVSIWLDDVQQAATAFTGPILTTSGSVSVLEFDGICDDLRIGSTSAASPTWVANFEMEADQISSTQIADQTGNGNHINYILGALPTGVTVSVGPLVPVTSYTSIGADNGTGSIPSVIKTPGINLFENTTATGENLLLYPIFKAAADNMTWSTPTLYSVMFLEASIAFGFAATIGTGTLFFGALAGLGLLTLGAATGMLAWWVPLLLGLLTFMTIVVFREL